MSSNPRNYNTEDRVRWERYADAFRDWLAKRGPYPGEPPAGYLEVYKTIQRYAPCPHEYAALVSAELRPILSHPGPQSVSGVSMSSDAFSAMLTHQSAMQAQMADLARQVGHGARGRGRDGGDLHGNDHTEDALEEPLEEEDAQALPFERDVDDEQPMAVDGETREWTPEY
ncbi:hypothetical protein FKP32DRAFT_1600407 [Trametes sanguinea]|nr:hypothetical protein FKP32DRAFT_1600407 [Trametes sanguinea]